MTEQMNVTMTDYVDVERRAAELGCNVPTGVAILPRGFETAATWDELAHEDTAPTVRTLLRGEGIDETPLEREGERFPLIEENSFEWVGPAIFIGASTAAANHKALIAFVGAFAKYLTEYFKGRVGSKKAKIEIIVPQGRTGKYTKIKYDGDLEGLKQLPDLIDEARNGRAAK